MVTIKKQLYRAASAFAIVGFVASPLVAGAVTDTTTISASVGSTISISNNTPTVSLSLSPGGSAVESIGSDVVTVNTNNTGGYTLEIGDSDANTNLVSGGNSIATTTGETDFGAGTPTALSTNSWGYCIASTTACDGSYTTGDDQVPGASFVSMKASGSEDTVKVTGTTATNDTTTFYYGVTVNSSQPTGTYSDTITYTATTN